MKTLIRRFAAVASLSAASMLAADEAGLFQVEVNGDGPAVVLIHGLACSGAVWDETVEHFRESYEMHVVSLAGMGGTPVAAHEGKYLDSVSDALKEYIRKMELENAIIVGHSLGGFLAISLGIEMNEELGGIVVVDGLPFLPAAMNPMATAESMKPMAEQIRQGMLAQSGSGDGGAGQRRMLASMITAEEDIETVFRWGAASDAATVASAMYELNTTDLRGSVSRIKIPTLVLGAWIEYEKYGQTREATQMRFDSQFAGLETYELRLSDKGKHFIMMDDPDFFFASLEGFLGR